jgi:hypothetical protein
MRRPPLRQPPRPASPSKADFFRRFYPLACFFVTPLCRAVGYIRMTCAYRRSLNANETLRLLGSCPGNRVSDPRPSDSVKGLRHHPARPFPFA